MVAKIAVRASRKRQAPACWPERIVLAALALFVGVGGMFGGVQMLADPVHPMGMSPQMIAGSPYDSYTQPGLLLLLLLGVIPVLVAVGLLVRSRGAVAGAGLLGGGLAAWIVVQWALLADRLWLQPVIFAIGAVTLALALLAYRRGAR
jgi:hypothetical protein